MAKIILFTDFIKPNKQVHLINAVNYIANSKDVEINKKQQQGQKLSTHRQDSLIGELVESEPNLKKTFEYINFKDLGTIDSASLFITSAEEVLTEASMTNLKYLNYIATREGVEQKNHTSHGLFGNDGEVDLVTYREKLRSVEGNVFRHVVAIKSADAVKNGFDHREPWEQMLRKEMELVAKVMNFKPGDMEWAGAFHKSESHPHVHIMMWSKSNDQSIFLRQAGLEKIKGTFGKNIYQAEYHKYYEFKENVMTDLKVDFETFDFESDSLLKTKMSFNILKLHSLIPSDYTGRWNYGFMDKDTKLIIDDMVNDIVTLDENTKEHFDEYINSELDFLSMYESKETYENLKNNFVHPSHSDKKPLHNIMLNKYKEFYYGRDTSSHGLVIPEVLESLFNNEDQVGGADNYPGDIFYHFKDRQYYSLIGASEDTIRLVGLNDGLDRFIPSTALGNSYVPATLSHNAMFGNIFRSIDTKEHFNLCDVHFEDNKIVRVTLESKDGHMEVLPCDFENYMLVQQNDPMIMDDFIFDSGQSFLKLAKSLASLNNRGVSSSSNGGALKRELEKGAQEDKRIIDQIL